MWGPVLKTIGITEDLGSRKSGGTGSRSVIRRPRLGGIKY